MTRDLRVVQTPEPKYHIVYLLGAGASANTLPVINQMPDRIKSMIELLEKREYRLSDNEIADTSSTGIDLPPKTYRSYQNEMIDALYWMYEESSQHSSIDTFARKLYLRGKSSDELLKSKSSDELRKLKIAMSIYFTLEQIKNKPDYRYDTFFASILTDDLKIPDHVTILSWNYDYQFELAYAKYSQNDEIEANDIQSRIHKINGTAELTDIKTNKPIRFIDKANTELNIETIKKIVEQYANSSVNKNKYETKLSFAWDSNSKQGDIDLNLYGKDIILVVIGYSFPFFNREVDSKIIAKLHNPSTHILRKLYIQAPESSIEDIVGRAKRYQILQDCIIHKFEKICTIDQFHLPNEF